MTVDRETIEIYDGAADVYEANRPPRFTDRAEALTTRAAGPVVDLGCGTGAYLPSLGSSVIGLDASASMLERASTHHKPLVRADLGRLPFRPGAVAAAWARNSYLHVPHDELPLALAEPHRALPVGARVSASFINGRRDHRVADDDLPGRNFWLWTDDDLVDLFVGAGFDAVVLSGERPRFVDAIRARSLPDTVAGDLRLLVCGLNPSLHAADAGVGFVTPGNRFWPAALDVGLASVDRDPFHAARHHGMGMTDLAKRATTRADELAPDEYREGLARVERLCERLRPGAVCMVGLAGWRTAVDRKAVAGWQDRTLGGRPVYVMPSTSGLNAHSTQADLTAHLQTAANSTK